MKKSFVVSFFILAIATTGYYYLFQENKLITSTSQSTTNLFMQEEPTVHEKPTELATCIAIPKSECSVNKNDNTYYLGFTCQRKELCNHEMIIEGTLPKWLNGNFLTIGPAQFALNDSTADHWLDGFAMLHQFKISNTGIKYSNAFIDSGYRKESLKKGKITGSTPPPTSTFSKWASLFSSSSRPVYDNTNVNIIKMNDHYIALTESTQPMCCSCTNLKKQKPIIFDDKLSEAQFSCAHPHYDPVSKELISYATTFARSSTYTIYTLKEGSTERVPLCKLPVSYPSYMHSFAVTPHYIILIEVPFVVNPIDLVLKGKSFIETFKWKPKLGTNFIVVDRNTGKHITTLNTDAFFALHQVNAFEQNGKIILDMISYKNPDIIKAYYLDYMKDNSKPTPQGNLKRFTLDPANKKIATKLLSSHAIELPRINYDNNATSYNYVYATETPVGAKLAQNLVKINVNTGKSTLWNVEGYPTEPIFVARPGTQSEDDGIILSLVLDPAKKQSFLVILDAKDMKEIARAYAPHHIPFTVHGYFCR
ncbi:MAG: carotenoid oxygenase family protein [Candidatus Dependentiae bacterium]